MAKLEGVEQEKEAKEQSEQYKPNRKTRSNNKPRTHNKGAKSTEGSYNNSSHKHKFSKEDKYCSYCKKPGRNYWSHDTTDCHYKDDRGKEDTKQAHAMKKLQAINKKMERKMAKLEKKIRKYKSASKSGSDEE